MKKIFLYLFVISFVVNVQTVYAKGALQPAVTAEIGSQGSAIADEAGFDKNTSVADVLSMVIEAFLGLLGIIFIYLIVIAGYNYMTAAGDESKVEKATNTIQKAVIGLIIVIGAYAITAFVFQNLPEMAQ